MKILSSLANRTGRKLKVLYSNPKGRLILVAAVVAVVLVAVWGAKEVTTPKAQITTTRGSLEYAASQLGEEANYDAAIRPLKGAVDDAATPQGKYEALVALAAMYQNKNDNRNALKYFKEADDIPGVDATIDLYLGGAKAAAAVGDKEQAKTYYNKAIEYYTTQADDPFAPKIIRQLTDELSKLGE